MNRLVVVLSTAVIILSIVCGFLFYQLNYVQNQIDTIEARLSNYPNLVKITDVEVYGFSPIICVTIVSKAKVTIENIGVNDVEGLSLNIFCNQTNPLIQDPTYGGETYSLDGLRSGEKREETHDFTWKLAPSPPSTGSVIITLRLGNVTLDEYIIQNFPN
jgi:hypothetical protein